MKSSVLTAGAAALWLTSVPAHATGVVPETSVVIIDQGDGEGAINVRNTDDFPVLLITTLINTADDPEELLIVTPPAARLEPDKTQRVRFILTHLEPLKTERLKRVTFDGVPPQEKGKSQVLTTIRQNLPVIIRPAGLEKDLAPWKHLAWSLSGDQLTVSNPSPYVVRLAHDIQTLPDNTPWTLPNAYVLPGQRLTVKANGDQTPGTVEQVRIAPATTWGYSVDLYDAAVSQ
ncbi:fimbria/pilus chaperone family protein [Pseudomonas sp. dw_358]|uniref:fimbria/pilus chaperone family protein n=1 Tax=Pseudomonas sp. dw_358 TaxID=2720083 RepID=UPI001BD6DCDD|nr:fimbria/pilus chaperone family protein [Pseudomonas sp. dw_358]